MKYWLLLISLSLLLVPYSVGADEGWVIEEFASDIEIRQDGVVEVTEKISVDFFELEKHGIFRDLPFRYSSDDGDVYTEVEVLRVLQDGSEAEIKETRNSANLRIRVGDSNVVISGKHVYEIVYEVTGVLRGFDELDELYWNVTGHDWPVVIDKVLASVSLPNDGVTQASCLRGYFGSSETCEVLQESERRVTFSTGDLTVQEGMTVAVGFSKEMVPLLTVEPLKDLFDLIIAPISLVGFGVVSLVGVAWVIRQWWYVGRDRKTARDNVVGAEYESPAGLRPAEIGVVMDERADTLDVSATIVDLAVRGYLKIEEIDKKWFLGKTDYVFIRIDKSANDLIAYEGLLLERLFEDGSRVNLSDLKNKFYKDLVEVKSRLYEDVAHKKLFFKNPQKVRVMYALIGVAMAVVGVGVIVLGVFWQQAVLVGSGGGLDVVGVVMVAMAYFMPRRTARGREVYRKSKGFKLFVSGTEKYRQPYFEKRNIFMEVLPYAIVFGVTKKLAQAFKEMGIEPSQPVWFVSSRPFNAEAFGSDINSFSSTLSRSIASSPSSSGSGGGGFSGGGFGGGGGGSW